LAHSQIRTLAKQTKKGKRGFVGKHGPCLSHEGKRESALLFRGPGLLSRRSKVAEKVSGTKGKGADLGLLAGEKRRLVSISNGGKKKGGLRFRFSPFRRGFEKFHAKGEGSLGLVWEEEGGERCGGPIHKKRTPADIGYRCC